MYDLLDAGYVYIAMPPLYKITKGKEFAYASDEDEKEHLVKQFSKTGSRGLEVQRYKGLGEMNPDQLWETTLDPQNRSLIQVKIDDEESTKGVFEDLMGENVLPRKEFIESRADKVVNLDI